MALDYSRGEGMAGLPRARHPVRSTFGRRADRPATVRELGRAGSCSHPPADRPKTRFGRRSVHRATGRKLCASCEGLDARGALGWLWPTTIVGVSGWTGCHAHGTRFGPRSVAGATDRQPCASCEGLARAATHRPKTRFGRRSVRRATGRKLCASCEGLDARGALGWLWPTTIVGVSGWTGCHAHGTRFGPRSGAGPTDRQPCTCCEGLARAATHRPTDRKPDSVDVRSAGRPAENCVRAVKGWTLGVRWAGYGPSL